MKKLETALRSDPYVLIEDLQAYLSKRTSKMSPELQSHIAAFGSQYSHSAMTLRRGLALIMVLKWLLDNP